MLPVPPDSDSVIRLVRPEVRAERAYHVGGAIDPPVKLNQNESPFDLPAELKQEIADAFLRIPFNRYPTEQPESLAAALAERDRHPAEGILVGNGSNELVYTLGLALVSRTVQVVLPRPMFSLYDTMVRLHGGKIVPVAPNEDFGFNVDGILRAIDRSRPELTVVASPNNPTGLALAPDDIERIVRRTRGIVLVDEAYVEFNPHGTVLPLVERYPNVLVLRTLSKAFGLAGLRVGYLLGEPRLVSELLKARVPFMVDRFSQAVARAVLGRPDLVERQIERIRASTAELTRSLEAMPSVDVVRSATNFVLFRTPHDAEALRAALEAAGIQVRSVGSYPELRGWLRVSAGTDDENRHFLHALKAALAG